MFILLDSETGGVYAIHNDETRKKTVQIFVDKEDAERYNLMLEAIDYDRTLKITEVEFELIVHNCEQHQYDYVLITPDDVVVPPL